MGLHCSRQGYIQDFHELQESRLGPEGECFPADRVKKVDRNASLATHQIEHQLTALLQDEKLAKRLSASLCLAANINCHERALYGERSYTKELLVNLPPEGKACTESDFVELPISSSLDELKKKPLHWQHFDIVRMPSEDVEDDQESDCTSNAAGFLNTSKSEEDAISEAFRYDVSSMATTDDDVIEKVTSRGEDDVEDEDQWMYTLYDFQDNGIVTKQDVNRLMDSICSVVTNSLTPLPCHVTTEEDLQKSREQQRASNNLKVRLEIGQYRNNSALNHQQQHQKKKSGSGHTENNHRRRHQDDRNNSQKKTHNNRYHTSKIYNGLIFPPPNSEEAAKVSSYIENKILSYRQQQEKQQQQQQPSKRMTSLSNDSNKTCIKCTDNHPRHNSNNSNNSRDRFCYRRSSADNHHRRHPSEMAGGRLVTTKPLMHHYQTDISSFSNTRARLLKRSNSCDVTNSNSDNSLSPSSMSGSETPFSVDEVFLRNPSTKECDNEDHPHQQSLLRFNHSCSCKHRRINSKLRGCDNIFAPKQQQRENSDRLASKIISIETTTSTTISSGHNEEKKISTSLEDLHKDKPSGKASEGRNAHRKKCRRSTPSSTTTAHFVETPQIPSLMTSHARPEVWPGKAASVTEEPMVDNNNKLPQNMTQLCFCKRMMGLDYPCKHSR